MKQRSENGINETTLYILLSLVLEDLSGYGITKKIKIITNEKLVINSGIMYPTLKKLTEKGYIHLIEIEKAGRNKKIYKIKEEGKKAIELEQRKLEKLLLEINKYYLGEN